MSQFEDFPTRPENMSTEWLTDALHQAGLIGEEKVAAIESQAVGNGMIGDSICFTLDYDRPSNAPASVVGKFAAAEPVSRHVGMQLGIYRNEIQFYREIAPTVKIRIPACYYTGFNETSGEFLLLMEDLRPARDGNQIAGCSLEDARHAIRQAAALHAPRWNDASLHEYPWLAAKNREAIGSLYTDALPGHFDQFCTRYGDAISDEHLSVCQHLIRAREAILHFESDNFAVTHSDFRLDNMLFDIKGGTEPLAVVDWQTPAIAKPGASDVAYFLSAAIPAEVRREHEDAFLELYLQCLREQGVKDYDMPMLRRDYAATALTGAMTAIFAAIGTGRTERGDAMFLTMLRGSCQLALDHNTLDFYP